MLTNLGAWPFEIGLWVGKAATPNRMGAKGDNDRDSARAKTIAFKNDDRKPSPIPLENCPWCNTKFKASSFQPVPDTRLSQPTCGSPAPTGTVPSAESNTCRSWQSMNRSIGVCPAS